VTTTKYRVLRGADGGYFAVNDHDANSAESAIRAVARTLAPEDLEEGMTLVAVPVGNWTEEPVKLVVPPPRLVIGGDAAPAPQPVPQPPEEPAA
jgi:hypothetical protein